MNVSAKIQNGPNPVAPVSVVQAGESEHPGLSIPFRIRIEGRWLEGLEISLTQLSAVGLVNPQLTGITDAVLQFPFSGFNVDVSADVETVQVSAKTGVVKFQFADVFGPQRIVLQSVFNAYIAGELTQFPGLLGNAAVKNGSDIALSAKGRGFVSRAATGIGKSAKGLLALAAGVALAAFVVERIHQRVFVTSPQTVSSIGGDVATLVAPSSGLMTEVSQAAAFGQPIAGILSGDGKLQVISMPCVCEVAKTFVTKGAVVTKDDPILAVMPQDGELFIKADAQTRILPYLKAGAPISVTFADGSMSTASLRSVLPVDDNAEHLALTLSSGKPLDVAQLGEPVVVSYDTFPVVWTNLRQTTLKILLPIIGKGE
jgi:hypothetical protein